MVIQRRVFYCPRCSKEFPKEVSVSRHLRQPNSTCARRRAQSAETHIRLPREDTRDDDIIMDEFGAGSGVGVENDQDGPGMSLDNNLEDLVEIELNEDSGADGATPINRVRRASNPDVLSEESYMTYHPNVSASFGRGETFMDSFDKDKFAELRKQNLYYPFASRMDWEAASTFHNSRLSMAATNTFLAMEILRRSSLSFRNAKQLRGRIEMLPAGSKWKCRPMEVPHPAKHPVRLFYRDALECLAMLMKNPLNADHLEFTPYRIYEDAEKKTRLYTEWLSGDVSYYLQGILPVGGTLLGVILSSDKTTVSVMTGNRVAYPLLISLANIKQSYRLQSSHGTFMLLALLPVVKFIHSESRMRSLLQDRLIHECLDIILRPLKQAAISGCMMTDPLGMKRRCFTMLASYTVDTPEAQLLACVGGMTSPVTMAYYKQFGYSSRQEPRTASTTLGQLEECKLIAYVDDLPQFLKAARSFRLNGVHKPFWRNWRKAEPSMFLTPEPLHHWHKQFWDHDARWCINILGAPLMDFIFSLLHIRTGYRQFREGISQLKQVTGRTQREVQRYIIPVICLIADWKVVFAIRSLMDFRYWGQSTAPSERILRQMLLSLQNFHTYKDAIIRAGGRLGGKGNILEHFYIPKVELYQSVVPNIIANGAAAQYSADITEHCHITEVKEPARLGNNQNYDQQIVRALDREDKRKRFDLATSIRSAGVDFRAESSSDDNNSADGDEDSDDDARRIQNSSDLLLAINPVSRSFFGAQRKKINYFKKAQILEKQNSASGSAPRTFVHNFVAFNLSRDPTMGKKSTLETLSEMYGIPDIKQATAEYIHRVKIHGDAPCQIGGRRSSRTESLPFDFVQVWWRLRIQLKAYTRFPFDILEPQTINCYPPSPKYRRGLYDFALVNVDASHKWPGSKLTGHAVVRICMIFKLVPPRGTCLPPGMDSFLAYVQRFDIQNQYGPHGRSIGQVPNAVTGMYGLRRSHRSDGSRQGGIIQVKHIRTPLSLVPQFRKDIDARLNKDNCMDFFTDFWLNDYFDKDIFLSLRS